MPLTSTYAVRGLHRSGLESDTDTAAALLEDLADHALRSKFEPVVCLEAPEPVEVPISLLPAGGGGCVFPGRLMSGRPSGKAAAWPSPASGQPAHSYPGRIRRLEPVTHAVISLALWPLVIILPG
jgi:hypothetical protein